MSEPSTAILFYHEIHYIISAISRQSASEVEQVFENFVELDGAASVVSAKEKVAAAVVFDIFKRGDKVYTVALINAKRKVILCYYEKNHADSVFYMDSLRSYGAMNVSGFHHLRINHGKAFAGQQNHINGLRIYGIR